MKIKWIKTILPTVLLIIALTACSGRVTSSGQQVASNDGTSDLSGESIAYESGDDQVAAESSSGDVETSAAVSAEHTELHEDSDDYIWETDSQVNITLNGDSIYSESAAVKVEGTKATITAAGNYLLSGSLSDGQIVVDTEDEDVVRLILNGVDIYNSSSSTIYILKADKVLIVLAEGSQNKLSDGSTYNLPDAESDEPNATLFSTSDLTITGGGDLAISANYNDAIASKDGLIINGDSFISINAVDDGIRGKDYVVVNSAILNITTNGDGLKSDEADDPSKGFVTIESGTIDVIAGADAIDAETDVTILGGSINLQSGGGSGSNLLNMTSSAKGIVGGNSVAISGGIITIDSADDALHSNNTILIQDGSLTIASGDDGIHSDSTLTIDGGQIEITKSYEGMESAVITINAGDIQINASDDGINLAGGADGSGMNAGMPGGGGGRRGGPGQDVFTAAGSYYLYINGGTILVDADGDGIDSNGSIEMTGGTVIVNGPTNSANGALDYMGTFNISGGYFIAAGSSGMAQAPSNSSSQASVYMNLNYTIQNNEIIHVESSNGETIFNFTPSKEIQNIVFSTPDLLTGETYHIYVGGQISGTSSNSLFSDVSYSGGSEYTSFSITDVITQIGGGGGMFRH